MLERSDASDGPVFMAYAFAFLKNNVADVRFGMNVSVHDAATNAKTRLFRMQLHSTLLQLLPSQLLPQGTSSSRMVHMAFMVSTDEGFAWFGPRQAPWTPQEIVRLDC